MKSSIKSLFLPALALALPLLLAGCDTASTAAATKFRAKIAAYDVKLPSAIEIAERVEGGAVVIDAAYDDDRWEVVLVSGGKRTRVAVDPMTGAIEQLSQGPASSQDIQMAELVANAPTSFAEALIAAQGAAPGSLPYEISAGLAVFEVDLVDETTFLDAKVDPLDGECDDVEEDEDEDPEEDDDDDEEDEDDDDDDDDDEEDEEDDAEGGDEAEDEEDDAEGGDEAEDEEDDAGVDPGCEADDDVPGDDDDDAQCIPGAPCTDGDGG
jgi:hypothetical protein